LRNSKDQFADTFECLLTAAHPVVKVNVAPLRLLHASAISMLLRKWRLARRHGCDLYVRNLRASPPGSRPSPDTARPRAGPQPNRAVRPWPLFRPIRSTAVV